VKYSVNNFYLPRGYTADGGSASESTLPNTQLGGLRLTGSLTVPIGSMPSQLRLGDDRL